MPRVNKTTLKSKPKNAPLEESITENTALSDMGTQYPAPQPKSPKSPKSPKLPNSSSSQGMLSELRAVSPSSSNPLTASVSVTTTAGEFSSQAKTESTDLPSWMSYLKQGYKSLGQSNKRQRDTSEAALPSPSCPPAVLSPSAKRGLVRSAKTRRVDRIIEPSEADDVNPSQDNGFSPPPPTSPNKVADESPLSSPSPGPISPPPSIEQPLMPLTEETVIISSPASEADDVNSTQADNVNSTQADNVNSTQADNVNSTQADNINSTQADNVNSIQANDVNSIQADNANYIQADNVDSIQADNVNTIQADDVNSIQANDVDSTQANDVNSIQADNVNTIQADDVSSIQANDVDSTQANDVNSIQANDVNSIQADSTEVTQAVTTEVTQAVTTEATQAVTTEAAQAVTTEAAQADTINITQTDTDKTSQADTTNATLGSPISPPRTLAPTKDETPSMIITRVIRKALRDFHQASNNVNSQHSPLLSPVPTTINKLDTSLYNQHHQANPTSSWPPVANTSPSSNAHTNNYLRSNTDTTNNNQHTQPMNAASSSSHAPFTAHTNYDATDSKEKLPVNRQCQSLKRMTRQSTELGDLAPSSDQVAHTVPASSQYQSPKRMTRQSTELGDLAPSSGQVAYVMPAVHSANNAIHATASTVTSKLLRNASFIGEEEHTKTYTSNLHRNDSFIDEEEHTNAHTNNYINNDRCMTQSSTELSNPECVSPGSNNKQSKKRSFDQTERSESTEDGNRRKKGLLTRQSSFAYF